MWQGDGQGGCVDNCPRTASLLQSIAPITTTAHWLFIYHEKVKGTAFFSLAVLLSMCRLICVSLGVGKHSQATRCLFSILFTKRCLSWLQDCVFV